MSSTSSTASVAGPRWILISALIAGVAFLAGVAVGMIVGVRGAGLGPW